jgi:hypothetical protein
LVAQGEFDRVENVLERVGVPEDQIDLVNGNRGGLSQDWAFSAFGVWDNLQPYCAVFLNCGIDESPFRGSRANPVVIENLRRFVEEKGGTLYASDQSYDVVEAVFPAKVDWFRDDGELSDAEYGLEGLITASITDDGLLTYLQSEQPGQETVSINFAYQRWALVQVLDTDVQVFLRANVQACADGEACTGAVGLPDTPLTLRFPAGGNGGQVVFTSFHVETREGETVLSTPDTDRVMRFLMTL